jgi:hypothetical protein
MLVLLYITRKHHSYVLRWFAAVALVDEEPGVTHGQGGLQECV